MMRKTICALSAAAAVLAAAPAFAQPQHYPDYAAPAAGVVAGTVAGLGVSEGWWGATVAGSALPATTAGAAAVGGVVGVGTIAAVDAFVQPCRGVAALFDINHGACVNGQYVGYAAPAGYAPRRVYRPG
jgi:hypothetical protein